MALGVAGIAWIAISAILLEFDQASVTTVGVLVGFCRVRGGAERRHRGRATQALESRALHGMALGLRDLRGAVLGAAIASFISPEDTSVGLADMLGFLFLLVGLLVDRPASGEADQRALVVGLISGILMTILGFWTAGQFWIDKAYLLLVFAGIWALMEGIVDVVRAFEIREVHKDGRAAVQLIAGRPERLHGRGMTPPRRTGWKAADLPRMPVLFVNPRSGGGAAARARAAERAQEQGIEAVELGGDQELGGLVDQAVAGGADALGMAGGDGSLAVALPPLPRRTAFHPRTRGRVTTSLETSVWPGRPAGALCAFGDGVEGRIDLWEANGRSFLNLVSLGVYGEAVRRSGVPRCEGTHAARNCSRRPRSESSGARAQPRGRSRRAAPHSVIVLVSNNPYTLGADRWRAVLAWSLTADVSESSSSTRCPGTGIRRGGRGTCAPLRCDAPSTMHAGVDGEAMELALLLRFSIRLARRSGQGAA